MYTCVHVCACVCVYMCVHVCTCVSMSVHVHVWGEGREVFFTERPTLTKTPLPLDTCQLPNAAAVNYFHNHLSPSTLNKTVC